MVHQYKNNGYNMVLDVASGSVHVVDDLTYEVIALYEDHTLEEIIKELSSWDEKDVKESYGEVTELKDAGVLFTEDCYEEYICGFKDRPTVVKALCLHIAHDCNLACRYCFAEEGEYKGRRALMSAEVGKKALDFLVENSGNRRNLEQSAAVILTEIDQIFHTLHINSFQYIISRKMLYAGSAVNDGAEFVF